MRKPAITILAIAIGLAFALAIFVSTRPDENPGGPVEQAQTEPPAPEAPAAAAPVAPPAAAETVAEAPPLEAPAAPAVPQGTEPATAAPPAAPGSAGTAAAPATPGAAGPLRVARVEAEAAASALIGSVEPDSPYFLRVELSRWGAGINKIEASRYNESALSDEPFLILAAPRVAIGGGDFLKLYPFAARAVVINGQRVELEDQEWALSPQASPDAAEYRLRVVDAQDQPVLEIVRTYRLPRESYDLRVEQRIVNLTPSTLGVAWEQNLQGDMPPEAGGDHRAFVAGYFDPYRDPGREHVFTRDAWIARHTVLDEAAEGGRFWPNRALSGDTSLAWVAALGRYFAATVHRPVEERIVDGQTRYRVLALDDLFPTLGMQIIGAAPYGGSDEDTRAAVFTLATRAIPIDPGDATDVSLSLFAGPRKSEIFSEPIYLALGFPNLIRYELGCTFCTFQPLARGLLWFLKVIHGVVFDWGVAIIILVIVVRAILHPITKRSQIQMTKMQRQMASLQPEVEKLKKKYAKDQQQLNAEMMKLYRERGVNPLNMLGCLPMLLQMPIWIALYAMLYFAIELMHQPAFYGVFQKISGGSWPFLADLSREDSFIPLTPWFENGIPIPTFFFGTFNLTALNVLPILMAVVFYLQQKLMSPPPANEQMAQQQKMMKWMTLLFPIFLYPSPSGLTLYILASTTAGIADSLIVRRHIKREEAAGTLLAKKGPPRPGSLMDRLQKALAAKQEEMMSRQGKDKAVRRPRP